jgi:hypothetical protein
MDLHVVRAPVPHLCLKKFTNYSWKRKSIHSEQKKLINTSSPFFFVQLQDTTNCGENALHMSWQDGGQSSSGEHAIEAYPELLRQPEHDSSMQIGYV